MKSYGAEEWIDLNLQPHYQNTSVLPPCRTTHLLSRELDGVGPPVVDDRGQAHHEDEGVEAQDPDGVPFFDDPSWQTDAKLHCLRAIRVTIVLPVVPERILLFHLFLLSLSSGNNIDQTANTYNLNACNEALIKTSKAKPKQLRLALLKHLLVFIVVNRVIIFKMLPKILQ